GFVDDHRFGCLGVILRGEGPSAEDGNAHGLEVGRTYGLGFDVACRLRSFRITFELQSCADGHGTGQWNGAAGGGAFDAGNRLDFLKNAAGENRSLVVLRIGIAIFGKVDGHGDEVVHAESGGGVDERGKAADQERGADEQRKSESDFEDGEAVAQTLTTG